MVFNWVCNRVMPLHIIVIEEGPPSSPYLLILYLLYHLIPIVLPLLVLLYHFLLHGHLVSEILFSHGHLLFLLFCHFLVPFFFLFSKLVSKSCPHVHKLFLHVLFVFLILFIKLLATIIIDIDMLKRLGLFIQIIVFIRHISVIEILNNESSIGVF